MNTLYAPYIRIFLRYAVGGAIIGSEQLGERLAADPDLILVLSAVVAALVELAYVIAWRKGRAT